MSTPRQDAIELLFDFLDYDFLVHDNLFEWLQEKYDEDDYDRADAIAISNEATVLIEELRRHLATLGRS